MRLVANARMYSVTAAAAAGWKDLFAWLSARSGVPLEPVDHPFPASLPALWSRPDLGCALMCGLPFAHARPPTRAITVPVPAPARYGGRAVYTTDFVVRADAGVARLEDTFGGRVGYTGPDSHSGFNAPRHHLLRYRSAARPTLYRESVGPLHTPRKVVEALLAGTIDVGPLDSYALDLMRRGEPALADRLKVVGSTAPAPIPLLVAGPDCPDAVVSDLRASLLAFGDAPECASLRDTLCLAGFAPVAPEAYDVVLGWEREADAAGYARPG